MSDDWPSRCGHLAASSFRAIITMRLNVLINEFGINSLPGGEVLSVLNRHEDRTSQEHLFNFD